MGWGGGEARETFFSTLTLDITEGGDDVQGGDFAEIGDVAVGGDVAEVGDVSVGGDCYEW